MAYLDVTAFKLHSVMPAEYIDAIELATPGWLAQQLEYWSRQIDSRLAKRYDVPFGTPYPDAVAGWLARIVTVRAWMKRGFDPSDLAIEEYKADAAAAMEEIKEAANAVDGLFDLPLRQDTTASGISRGGPLSYTEASPYVWADEQALTGRAEDSSRGGSYG